MSAVETKVRNIYEFTASYAQAVFHCPHLHDDIESTDHCIVTINDKVINNPADYYHTEYDANEDPGAILVFPLTVEEGARVKVEFFSIERS